MSEANERNDFLWYNGLVDRGTNSVVNGRIELRRSGDILVATNGVERLVPRQLPFVHNGLHLKDGDFPKAFSAMFSDCRIDVSSNSMSFVIFDGRLGLLNRKKRNDIIRAMKNMNMTTVFNNRWWWCLADEARR